MNRVMRVTLGMLFFFLIVAFSIQPVCAQTGEPADAQSKQAKPFLDIYGFIMMDAGYDFKQVHPDWFDVVRPTKLPSYQG